MTQPAPGSPGGEHVDAIVGVYYVAGAIARRELDWTPSEVFWAAVAWELVENGPLRSSLPYQRPDTLRDSALEVLAAFLGASLHG